MVGGIQLGQRQPADANPYQLATTDRPGTSVRIEIVHQEPAYHTGNGEVKVVDRNRTFTYKQLLRRALVGGKTVVVAGHNFKHLEPRPGFD